MCIARLEDAWVSFDFFFSKNGQKASVHHLIWFENLQKANDIRVKIIS